MAERFFVGNAEFPVLIVTDPGTRLVEQGDCGAALIGDGEGPPGLPGDLDETGGHLQLAERDGHRLPGEAARQPEDLDFSAYRAQVTGDVQSLAARTSAHGR